MGGFKLINGDDEHFFKPAQRNSSFCDVISGRKEFKYSRCGQLNTFRSVPRTGGKSVLGGSSDSSLNVPFWGSRSINNVGGAAFRIDIIVQKPKAANSTNTQLRVPTASPLSKTDGAALLRRILTVPK